MTISGKYRAKINEAPLTMMMPFISSMDFSLDSPFWICVFVLFWLFMLKVLTYASECTSHPMILFEVLGFQPCWQECSCAVCAICSDAAWRVGLWSIMERPSYSNGSGRAGIGWEFGWSRQRDGTRRGDTKNRQTINFWLRSDWMLDRKFDVNWFTEK